MGLAQHLFSGHSAPGTDTPGIVLGPGRLYDAFSAVAFGGRRGRVFARLATHSGARPGDRVIDIGCGTGALTVALAAAVAPGGSALGIDPSPTLLRRARQRTARLPNCSFAAGVAEALDLPDASFDLATSSLAIHHLPAGLRPIALGELRRVLRPGGRLFLADFQPPAGSLARRAVGALMGPAMLEQHAVGQLEDLVDRAGFTRTASGDAGPFLHWVAATRPGGGG